MVSKLLAVTTALASVLAAQTTWSVGPGAFALRDAMQFVSNGDTVLVAPGQYLNFACSKAITIRAAGPGTVSVNWSSLALPPSCGCSCISGLDPVSLWTVLSPPAGQSLHVVDIEFQGFYSALLCGTLLEHQVAVRSGRVTFDGCTMGHMLVENATAHFQDCSIVSQAPRPGLRATNADLTVVGGTIAGRDSSYLVTDGATLLNTRLHASDALFKSGDSPSMSAQNSAAGIQATGGSLWLSDSAVVGYSQCAVVTTGAVRVDRCSLVGGAANCITSPTGAPLLGMQRPGPIIIGATFQATITSQPGDLQLFYGSTQLAGPLYVSLVEQSIWLDPTRLFFSLVAVADAAGQTTLSFPVPAVPALVGEQFWIQGFGGSVLPLQSSAVVGGIVR